MDKMFEGLPSNLSLETKVSPALINTMTNGNNEMEERLKLRIAKVLEDSSASEYCDGLSSNFVESESSEYSDHEDLAENYVTKLIEKCVVKRFLVKRVS